MVTRSFKTLHEDGGNTAMKKQILDRQELPLMSASDNQSPTPESVREPMCTLLVSSCDKYADLWRPYFSLLWMRWLDCPFPVALITEERLPEIPGVRPLCAGPGLDWSTLMIRALDAVGTPYVLLTLEDFFLRRAVDTARILMLFADMRRQQLRMLRLVPRPGPTAGIEMNHEYGAIAVGAPWRVSTQAAFWHVETLRRLLVRGEAIWEFEVNGTMRNTDHDGFAAVWRAALPYHHHVVERGKWFPWSAWRFRRLGIGVDLSARPVMTFSDTVRWIIGKITGKLVEGMSREMRHALKPLARRCGLVE